MAYSKIIFDGETLIDLTSDTVTEDKLMTGITAHDKSGKEITGTCDFDVNSSDATVTSDEILSTRTAYARGIKIVGAMPNNGSVNENIESLDNKYTIPRGYHDGSGTVGISAEQVEKIIPSNIREGVNILGVIGEMSGNESENAEESKEVTPKREQQTITPSEGYTCFREVIVKGIPYSEIENSAGGITVVIG